MSGTATNIRTFGTLIEHARTLLQDKLPTSGNALRYTDGEHFEAINRFVAELRAKRPDLFIPLGMRAPLPFYSAAFDMSTPFPFDTSVFSAFVYYLSGSAELREDTFSDDSRAVTLLNKAVAQILMVQS